MSTERHETLVHSQDDALYCQGTHSLADHEVTPQRSEYGDGEEEFLTAGLTPMRLSEPNHGALVDDDEDRGKLEALRAASHLEELYSGNISEISRLKDMVCVGEEVGGNETETPGPTQSQLSGEAAPPQWLAYLSAEHGKWYYCEVTTGETTWTKPENANIAFQQPPPPPGASGDTGGDYGQQEQGWVQGAEEASNNAKVCGSTLSQGEVTRQSTTAGASTPEPTSSIMHPDEEEILLSGMKAARNTTFLATPVRTQRQEHTESFTGTVGLATERKVLPYMEAEVQGSPDRAMPRTKEDRLIEKKAEYERRLEQLREEKLRQEEAELRQKPQTNKHSERLLAGQVRKPLSERATEQAAARREREERMKAELKAKEDREITRKPKINERSKKLSRHVEDMHTWEQERAARREARAHMHDKQQREEHTFQPTLNKTTQKIMQRKQQQEQLMMMMMMHEGDDDEQGEVSFAPTPLRVEDRLFQQAEQSRERKQEALQRMEDERKQSAKPQVAPHSANIPRSGDVASRLYNIAEKQRQKQMIAEHRVKVLESHQIDPDTGERLFQPKINRSSEEMVRRMRGSGAKVEDHLTALGHNYQKKQQIRKQHEDKVARQMHDKVKVNQRSEQIVERLEQRTNMSSVDRLAQPTGAVKKSTLDSVPKYSFKPRINASSSTAWSNGTVIHDPAALSPPRPPSSSRGGTSAHARYPNDIVRSPTDDEDAPVTLRPPSPPRASSKGPSIAERSMLWQKKRAAKEEAARQQREKERKAQCSFAPKVSTKASRLASNKSIIERNREWEARRAQKLDAERKIRELEELAECTFNPNPDKFDIAGSSGATSREEPRHPQNQRSQSKVNAQSTSTRTTEPRSRSHQRQQQQQQQQVNHPSSEDSGSLAQSIVNHPVEPESKAMEPLEGGGGDVVLEQEHVGVQAQGASRVGALPDGWLAFTADTGVPYYYQAATGVTQWHHPSVQGPDQQALAAQHALYASQAHFSQYAVSMQTQVATASTTVAPCHAQGNPSGQHRHPLASHSQENTDMSEPVDHMFEPDSRHTHSEVPAVTMTPTPAPAAAGGRGNDYSYSTPASQCDQQSFPGQHMQQPQSFQRPRRAAPTMGNDNML